MAQVDFENTTTMSVVSTRRRFLSQAAAVAAGGAALGAALPMPGSAVAAGQAPDPILEIIERHKATFAAYVAALAEYGALETELPLALRRSHIDAWGEEIVATDDPRYVQTVRAVDQTMDGVDKVACELLSVYPTTMAGLCGLIRYALDHDSDGEQWPRDLEWGGVTRSWQHFLLENILEVLPDLSQEGMAA